MAKDWIKLWKGILSNPKYMALTPAERSGLTALYIHADAFDGEFETEAQLKYLMREDYRYVPSLRRVGLLVGLTVYKGAEKQAAVDPTAPARMKAKRERDKTDRYAVTQKDVRSNALRLDKTREEEIREDDSSKDERHGGDVPLSWSGFTQEEKQRAAAIADGAQKFLQRMVKTSEREVIGRWACLTSEGEPVPVERILSEMERSMRQPDRHGKLPATLGWCADDVLAIGRGRQTGSLASLQAKVDALQAVR